MSRVGAVVIGRNEGERLKICLESLVGRCEVIVYVDSGSTDGSVALARSLGIEVVELDLDTPFTAARARNVGFDQLREILPGVDLVQFVDGDCEIAAGWIERAAVEMDARTDAAVVCGKVRERHPDRSVYNRLADLEWDTPTGEVRASGGIALIRVDAFSRVGGFDPGIIAAEDDEICLRLRQHDWVIVKLDAEMATHDMAMTRFGQWWKRSVRTGYAFADGMIRHGKGPDRHFVRESRGVMIWGFALPIAAITLTWSTWGLSLIAAACVLLAQVSRIQRKLLRLGRTPQQAHEYAIYCMIGKLPQAVGFLKYATDRIARRSPHIIEHKSLHSFDRDLLARR